MEWMLNRKLPVIRSDWKGNPYADGEFRYPGEPFRPSWIKMARWMLRPNPQRRAKRADDWRPPRTDDGELLLQASDDLLCWLGHASFYIQLSGLRMLIDPVLFDLPFLSRQVSLPFGIDKLREVDYVLISHDHRDHCDKKSLQALARTARPRKVLSSLGMGGVIKDWLPGWEVEESAWYQVYRTEGELEITYLPARHWCRRGLFDFNRVLWGSFLLRNAHCTIYVGADSGYGPHFAEIAELTPAIDLAIIGIGAYKPAFMMEEIHTSPRQALQAFQDLNARVMIPMHYGTYDLSDEPISEPYRHIQRLFREHGLAGRLYTPAVGEMVALETLL